MKIFLKYSIILLFVTCLCSGCSNEVEQEIEQVEKEEVVEVVEEQEPELNEDGCPVGSFKNYYGICQDEHLYEPQECPEGQIWFPSLNVVIDNGDGTADVDYEATFGIDGLPKGGCDDDYDTINQKLAAMGQNILSPDYKESYDHMSLCERGFAWSTETKTCLDFTASYRSEYEKHVLNKKSE